MTPTIALFGTLILIGGALGLHRSETKSVSAATWIPTLWFMLSASRGISYWLGVENGHPPPLPDNPDIGSPVDRLTLLVMLGVSLAILVHRRVSLRDVVQQNKALFLLLLFAFVSFAWSPVPGTTLKRAIRVSGDLTMALIVLTERDWRRAFRAVFSRAALVLLPLSIVLVKYYRYIGVAYDYTGMTEMWVGATTHKNVLGAFSAFTLLVVGSEMLADRSTVKLTKVAICAMSLYLLLGSSSSRSATSLVILAISTALLMALGFGRRFHSSRARSAVFLSIAIAATPLLTMMLSSLPGIGVLISALGRDITFTDRTLLWDSILGASKGRFFLGAGYGGFWIDRYAAAVWSEFGWLPRQSHNGYVEVFAQLGMVGVILLLAFIASVIRRFTSSGRLVDEVQALRFVLFCAILIHNATEASFLREAHLVWFTTMLASVEPPVRKETILADPALGPESVSQWRYEQGSSPS